MNSTHAPVLTLSYALTRAPDWVREMYAWCVAVHINNASILHEPPPQSRLLAQPPHDLQPGARARVGEGAALAGPVHSGLAVLQQSCVQLRQATVVAFWLAKAGLRHPDR